MGKPAGIDPGKPVTDEDIAAAEAARDAANEAAEAAKDAFLKNVGEWSDYKAAEAEAEFAAANVLRLEHVKNEQEAQANTQKIAELRKSVIAEATKAGNDLTSALASWWAETQKLEKLCTDHSQSVTDFVKRAKALGIPDKGVSSEAHSGLAVSAGGEVIVDGHPVDGLEPWQLFGWFFHSYQGGNGVQLSRDKAVIDGAFKRVEDLKKAGK